MLIILQNSSLLCLFEAMLSRDPAAAFCNEEQRTLFPIELDKGNGEGLMFIQNFRVKTTSFFFVCSVPVLDT